MSMLTLLIATAAAAVSIAPAQDGSTVKEGRTAGGIEVELVVGEFGNATRFRIASHDVDCEHGTMSSKAVIRRRLDRSDPGSFSDVSTRAFKAGAITFRSTRRVEGTVASDGRAWRGSYRERTRLFEDGEQIDTCRLRTTWRVR